MASNTSISTASTSNGNSDSTLVPFAMPKCISVLPPVPVKNLPSPDKRVQDNVAAQLVVNLVRIKASVPILDIHVVKELIGDYKKLARSFFCRNLGEFWIDFVPKHDSIIPAVLELTGRKKVNGVLVYCKFELVCPHLQEEANLKELVADYTSMLVYGSAPCKVLDPCYLYPNADWEPPSVLIPVLLVPNGCYKKEVAANALQPIFTSKDVMNCKSVIP